MSMEPGTGVEGLLNAPVTVPRRGEALGRQRQQCARVGSR